MIKPVSWYYYVGAFIRKEGCVIWDKVFEIFTNEIKRPELAKMNELQKSLFVANYINQEWYSYYKSLENNDNQK
ncbi:MAG: hypothetical protein KatS3mg096_761 [Candidatus Parcubacteria bacterium]|nr:MAG: hypothetical protein KatS3mg096_761 [Candidatus Parcubacteria bacterium]